MLSDATAAAGAIPRLLDWLLARGWKRQYRQMSPRSGVYVLAPKPGTRAAKEPAHWLCAACFEQHTKSRLQDQGYVDADLGERRWQCHNDPNHFVTLDSNPYEHVLRESLTEHLVPEHLVPESFRRGYISAVPESDEVRRAFGRFLDQRLLPLPEDDASRGDSENGSDE